MLEVTGTRNTYGDVEVFVTGVWNVPTSSTKVIPMDVSAVVDAPEYGEDKVLVCGRKFKKNGEPYASVNHVVVHLGSLPTVVVEAMLGARK